MRNAINTILATSIVALFACTGGTTGEGTDLGSEAVAPDVIEQRTQPADVPIDQGGTDLPSDLDGWDDDADIPPDGQWNYGAPCEDDSDCDSGFCVQTTEGKICGQTCLENCPEGFDCVDASGAIPEPYYVCVPHALPLCMPCLEDADCEDPFGVTELKCANYGDDGSFCATLCELGYQCPDDYACKDVQNHSGKTYGACIKQGDGCECNQYFMETGSATACTGEENDHGACAGQRVCTEEGLGECDAPAANKEVCDEKDNDCDGEVDEELGGEPCENESDEGACPGETACFEGEWICDGPVPIQEECDGIDNDCNGETDEGFEDENEDGIPDCLEADTDGDGILDYKDNCPELENPEQEDLDGDGAGDICDDDMDGDEALNDEDCAPLDPAVHPGADELCNLADDDCDGQVDEEVATEECPITNDLGSCTGELVCVEGEQMCQGPEPVPEECDGADNNCNGEVDEDLGGEPCANANALGICEGLLVCINGDLSCDAPFPGIEVCDGVDNDCDGGVDNDLPPQACFEENEHGTCSGFMVCPEGELTCDAQVPGPEVCDGIDNDCDFGVDENTGGKPCALDNEFGSCDGTVQCWDGAEVCDAAVPGPEICDGLDNNCNDEVDEGADGEPCEFSNELGTCQGTSVCFDGVPGCDAAVPAPEVCDGIDNDCDGELDEGTGGAPCQNENQNGVCTGAEVCVDGGLECDAPSPKPEVCDGVDNNCDGEIDEGLGTTTCGQGECEHTVDNCVAGVPQICDEQEGAEVEKCDGLDNDCNGELDDGIPGAPCFIENLHGTCWGETWCNGGLTACDAPAPAPEACDGLDNDCDDAIDEEIAPITCGLGPCEHTVVACVDGQPQICDPLEGFELENCDGIDNDCNGEVDDGLGTTTCGLGECEHTVDNCLEGAPQSCDPMLGSELEECDGLDNNCEGSVDEGFPNFDNDLEADCIDLDDDNDGDPDLSDCEPFNPNVYHGADEVCYNGLNDDCDADTPDICDAQSCLELLNQTPGLPSGDYMIDPDGEGAIEPFEVFCDMEYDGGGWTGFTIAQAHGTLGGELAVVVQGSADGIDAEGRPYCRDQGGGHTCHYTFDVPFGFTEFWLKDYQSKAYAYSGYTTDQATGSDFIQSVWGVGYKSGGWGDVSFGIPSQSGPVTSYAAEGVSTNDCSGCSGGGAYISCTSCTFDWPAGNKIYTPGVSSDQFRIGFGEHGPEHEGWYAWWSGDIMVR